MSNTIRIKRRASDGDAGISGVTLKNGELAYNEADDILYYGYGVSGANAAQIKGIAGVGAYVNLTTAQSVGGVKTLTDLLKPNAGINVNSGKFTVAAATGNVVTGGTLNGHTIPGGTGTLALTTDALATTSGHNYITLSGQDIVQGDVVLGTHTSGNYVGDISAASGTPGITVLPTSSSEGTAVTVAVDSTVARTNGATFTGLVNANAGIAVDTDKFTVADGTGNTSIAGTLAVTSDTTLDGLTNADGGIAVATNKFTVSAAGVTAIQGTHASLFTVGPGFTVSGDGHITSGEFKGTAVAAAFIGNLPASKVTSGTFDAARIPSLNASKIGSGTLPVARLPVATTTANGAIKIFSDVAQTVAANSATATAGKSYGIQLNSSGQAVVNVPWSDNDTGFRPVKVGSATLDSSETLEIVGGTNVTVTESAGVVTFNSTATATRASLNIDTDDDVVFKNLELGGASNAAVIKGPATLTIDPAAHGDNTGTVVIDGNLTVEGTTTTINSTIVSIDDLAIELANNATTAAGINGAGIRIGDGGTSAELGLVEFLYSNPNSRMELSSAMKITGGLEGTVIDGGTF